MIYFNFFRSWNYIYIKLCPDTVHKVPISFHIKIYLRSLVEYQHQKNCFCNPNITLNYYFKCKIYIRGNFLYLEMPLVASNIHILTSLSRSLSKILNISKRFVPAAPIVMLLKVLKYFSIGKLSFFLFNLSTQKRANRKRVLIPRKKY